MGQAGLFGLSDHLKRLSTYGEHRRLECRLNLATA